VLGAWNIRGLSAVFVIDAPGVVRARDVSGGERAVARDSKCPIAISTPKRAHAGGAHRPHLKEFRMTKPIGHERFMRRCLDLAVMARDRGDTPVGSVVVLDGVIIGEGAETLPTGSSISGHAEILACQSALGATGRRDLAGAVLYTTAEPCFMCAYAIRQLRIDRVIYGIETPVIGGATSVHPILTDPALNDWRQAPAVIGGVMREECENLRAR